jgi:hypothetical protein
MQNKIELHIETVYKEYDEVKYYLTNFKKNIEEKKKKVAQKTEKATEEETDEIFYNEIAWITALEGDFQQLTGRLYHTYQAYKDLIEIPQKIKEEVENLKFTLVFNVKAGEVETVDKEAYQFYKTQFFEGQKFLKSRMEK